MSVKGRVQQKQFRNLAEEAVVSLLVASGVVLQRLNDLLRGHGVTHDQFNVLRILRGVHPEGHPRLEIGRRMASRSPDVTRLLDRLERQGLIERGWAPENRRHSVARITGAGLALLARIDPELFRLQTELIRGVPEDELRALCRACDRMVG